MTESRRRFLVTGASKGIGAAIAAALARDGFCVTVHGGSDEAGARQVLHEIKAQGGEGDLLMFNVADTDKCREILEAHIEEYGPFYGIVSNAGITRDANLAMMSPEEWRSVLDVNLTGFYNVVHPCLMSMISARQGGRIIAVSSVSGIAGNRGQVNYAASKAGLIGAVKSLALELAKRRITVNAVAPGLIDTAMAQLDPPVLKQALSLIPMQRMGTVQEVAAAVSFLAGDGAAYITRQVISVNGGMI